MASGRSSCSSPAAPGRRSSRWPARATTTGCDAAGGRVDAFIDLYGSGYVELALELGVAPERIDTIADFDAPQRHPGVKTDGNMAGASAANLAELAALIAEGRLEVPIARVYPLAEVREAFTELERRHTLGKIVLRP